MYVSGEFLENQNQTDALYYKTLELQRKAESYFQHSKVLFLPTIHALTSVGRKSTFSMLKI